MKFRGVPTRSASFVISRANKIKTPIVNLGPYSPFNAIPKKYIEKAMKEFCKYCLLTPVSKTLLDLEAHTPIAMYAKSMKTQSKGME